MNNAISIAFFGLFAAIVLANSVSTTLHPQTTVPIPPTTVVSQSPSVAPSFSTPVPISLHGESTVTPTLSSDTPFIPLLHSHQRVQRGEGEDE